MQVSPTSGKTPLYVSVQATVNTTNSCVPATYTLDWGDQSQKISIPVGSGICKPLQQTYTHTYTTPAAFEITLSAGTHSSQSTVVAQP
jgi:PKD repeat protein